MATTTLITSSTTAVPAATEMNVAIPVGKRVIGYRMTRLLVGNAPLAIDDDFETTGVLTLYFDGLAIVSEHEVTVFFAEDIDSTPGVETLIDNGDGTFTFTSQLGVATTYNSKQVISVVGDTVTLTPGNSETLPSGDATTALLARITKLENCLAKLCKSCPSSSNA